MCCRSGDTLDAAELYTLIFGDAMVRASHSRKQENTERRYLTVPGIMWGRRGTGALINAHFISDELENLGVLTIVSYEHVATIVAIHICTNQPAGEII